MPVRYWDSRALAGLRPEVLAHLKTRDSLGHVWPNLLTKATLVVGVKV